MNVTLSNGVWIVCGSRETTLEQSEQVSRVLSEKRPSLVIVGCAAGVDAKTRAWCKWKGVDLLEAHALWNRYRGLAGPRRNALMARVGAALRARLLAFPGGKGTASMIREARKAGIEVERVEWGQP